MLLAEFLKKFSLRITPIGFQEDFQQVQCADHEKIRRVRHDIINQLSDAHIKALKAHDIACPDVLSCTKKVCWQYEPDKIVSEPYPIK